MSLKVSGRYNKRDSLNLERGRVGKTEDALELVPESGEAFLSPRSLGLEGGSDLANFGAHPCTGYDGTSSTFGDLRAGEDEADPVTGVSRVGVRYSPYWAVLLLDWLHLLRNGE